MFLDGLYLFFRSSDAISSNFSQVESLASMEFFISIRASSFSSTASGNIVETKQYHSVHILLSIFVILRKQMQQRRVPNIVEYRYIL